MVTLTLTESDGHNPIDLRFESFGELNNFLKMNANTFTEFMLSRMHVHMANEVTYLPVIQYFEEITDER